MVKVYMRVYAEWAIKLFDNICKAGFASACLTTRITGEPYSGNLYLRFDEDSGNKLPELLYRIVFFSCFFDFVLMNSYGSCIMKALIGEDLREKDYPQMSPMARIKEK